MNKHSTFINPKVENSEEQENLVKNFLGMNSVITIAKKSSISYTAVSELKRGVRSIDTLSSKSFEKLLILAMEEKNRTL